MELTNESKFEYLNVVVPLKHLLLLHPEVFKTYFIANNSYTLSEESVESVKKIRNRPLRNKILAVDTYRKELAKERKVHELYNTSDNLRMGNYNSFEFRMKMYINCY